MCRVECDPLCDINWFKNGELINSNSTNDYIIKQTVHQEEFLLNRFLSVVSTLKFNMPVIGVLNRYEDNANYSCQSNDTSIGPAVESQMKFDVECKMFIFLIMN